MSPEASRSLLPNSYYAFFAQFRHLSPIQSRAIGPVVRGKDVLLISATATGKTQAYCAPLVERYFAALKCAPTNPQSGAILIISPTRALVNDLYRRLQKPLAACGIELQRKTGDYRVVPQDPLSGVCITTPESLDSWLCRHARTLGNVRAVVLDELHVLAGTSRGSQLQLLLQRLEAVTIALGQPRPQRVAASATISHPEGLCQEYMGPEAEIVQDVQRRELQFLSIPYDEPAVLWHRLLEQFNQGRKKFLIFCATRREVEDLAESIKVHSGRPSLVLVHHGALSKSTRLRNEASFLRAAQGVLVATSSLELGLDIGDVDGVVLLGPPPDVSSFLQRAGRSGRRKGPSFLLGLYRNPREELILDHLAAAAQKGELLGYSPGFFASVLFQQAASLAFQNRNGFVASAAWQARLPDPLRQRFSPARLEAMLAHWEAQGFFQERQGRYYPTQILEAMHDRGKTHSNIEDTQQGQREVIEAETGRSLGHIRMPKQDQPFRQGGQVVLGGQKRHFLSTHGDGPLRTTVHGATSEGEGKNLVFGGRSLAPSVSRPLAQDFGEFLGLPPGSIVMFRYQGWVVFAHFWGTMWGELLGDVFRYTIRALRRTLGVGTIPLELKTDGYLLRLRPMLTPDQFLLCRERFFSHPPDWSKLLAKRMGKLGRVSGSGPWFGRLPQEDQWEDLSARLDFQGFTDSLRSVTLVPCPMDLQERLKLLFD